MRGIGLIRLRIGIIGEPCECGIEPPGPISHGVRVNTRSVAVTPAPVRVSTQRPLVPSFTSVVG